MKNYRIFVMALFVLVMMAVAAPVTALTPDDCSAGSAECSPGCHAGEKEHGSECGCDLDLNDEQKDKLHKLKIEYEKDMIDMKAELKKLELGMKEEMMKESPDKNSMMKHVDRVFEIRGKMKKGWLDMVFDAKKIVPADKWKGFIRCQMMHRRHPWEYARARRARMMKDHGCGAHTGMKKGCGDHRGMEMKHRCGG
ncbi:MAG: hypothetical protein GF417_07520 [Candidatus Latescibacteria bacterium]|nr:hypothetical protein [bacterium]MBD3424268.1 hypothetical protein [Candidatus Latescibacterota bacterium]